MVQNNCMLINLSRLEDYMRDILNPYRIGDLMMLPATYADSIHLPLEVLVVKGQHTGVYFDRMNALREKIEHENGLCVKLWSHLRQIHKLKLYNRNSRLMRRSIVYWFITNCYTCLNGNTVST